MNQKKNAKMRLEENFQILFKYYEVVKKIV
jgi:hypothetical protein